MTAKSKKVLIVVCAILYIGVIALVASFRKPGPAHQFSVGEKASLTRDFQATEPSMKRFNAQTGMPEIASMGTTCTLKIKRRITLLSKRPDGQFVVRPDAFWFRAEEADECRSVWLVVVPTSVMRWIKPQ